MAGKREDTVSEQKPHKWHDMNADVKGKQSDNSKRWHPRQNYQEKQKTQPPSYHQQHQQQQQQQQQHRQHTSSSGGGGGNSSSGNNSKRQQINTPRRRHHHQQYAERGLHSTLGSSPRPATALPWTNAQDDDRNCYERHSNNISHDDYYYSSASPLSSRALLSSSTPRSARQNRQRPPTLPSSTTANCHPTAKGRSAAGIQGPTITSQTRAGRSFNRTETGNNSSGDNDGQFGDSGSNFKSKKAEQVSCSNPYRKFYANLTSSASGGNNKGKSSSILVPNDTSLSSVTSKINASQQTECSSLDKYGDTGGETYRSAVKVTPSSGTLELGLGQSLYEDEFNQVAASPIYLQLLKARSTKDNRDRRSDSKANAHNKNNKHRPPVGRRSSVGILRPKSSYTASDSDGNNSKRSIQGVKDGRTPRRYSSDHVRNGNSLCSSNINEDSGGSIDNQSQSVHFYIDDDDDQEVECNVEDEPNDDNEDNDESDETVDIRSDSVARGLHQAKRGSVTFDVPDADEKPQSVSFHGQFASQSDLIRRMSAPELPPIPDANAKPSRVKGDKRKTSSNSVASSGSKASINQLAAAVNSKTFYNRKTTSHSTPSGNHTGGRGHKKKKLPIPRNHSDSSLKGLIANNSNQSQESCGSVTEGPGGGTGPLRQVKFLANGHRALSWCATENSGSQTKLETLFEGQNIISGNRTNGTPSIANNNNNNNNSGSSGNLPSYVTNNGESPDNTMPVIPPPRSVSVNGIRSRDELSRLVYNMASRKLHSEAGDEEIATVDDFASRSRMRRSQSENKLAGAKHFNSTTSLNSINNNNNNNNNDSSSNNKYNSIGSNNENRQRPTGKSKQKHSQRGMTRNLSVDRIDRLTSKPSRKSVSSNPAGAKNAHSMRRVNSVSALNTNKTPYLTTVSNNNNNSRTLNRNETNQEDVFNDDDDEECLEASVRLVEWLNIVNNVEEYDTDPKETVIEYTDEPPQTDTAVHVVYGRD